jgi:molecular chaperone GrpE
MTHGIDPDENEMDFDMNEESELMFGEEGAVEDDDEAYGRVKTFKPASQPDAEGDETDVSEETELSMADRLIAMEAEKTEIKDQLLRSMAEMENIRKRSERKLAEERIYAIEKFSRDLLNVADNLARALAALTDEAKAELSDAGKGLLQGIELTEKELIATLARHGVTAVDSIQGTEFDPNVHQAVAQIPSDQPEGTIAEPFQTGWKIGDRTLRAAMVAVSTGPEG